MSDSNTDTHSTTVELAVDSVGGETTLSKAETSTQLGERTLHTTTAGIKPPYNPDRLAAFAELNETLATGIRKKSRYEVGYGFTIVPVEDLPREEADGTEFELVRDFWRGPDSKWQTGPRQKAEPTSAEEVKELVRQDYHRVGYSCFEVLTDMMGVPVGLAHVPANTVRVRKPQSRYDQARHPETGTFVSGDNAEYASRGYVQVRDGQRRYFGEFGDRYRGQKPTISEGSEDEPPSVTYVETDDDKEPIFVDRETGDVATGKAKNLDHQPANELIFIRNPDPLEQDYGLPDWISATRTISADEAAKDYNREFFKNDTIPRMVIKVEGGKLSEQSRNDLQQMLDNLRAESHRAVILEVEEFIDEMDDPFEDGGTEPEISIEPMGQGISEEMDFRLFREKNEHEIAKVLEMPPIKIGVTDSANRANSDQQNKDFALEVIQPEQHKLAQRLYQTIHQTAFGVTDWTIEYELRGADNPQQEAKLSEQRVRAMRLSGVGTVDEAREELGLDPLGPPLGEMTLQEFEAEFQAGGGSGGETEQARTIDEPPAENKIGEKDWSTVEADLAAKDEIETMQFSSSNLDEGLYDLEAQELYLSFLREGGQSSLYAYVDIPPTEWSGLTNAASHGSYHYDSIRLEYPYIEITNFHDRLPEGPVPEDPPDDIPDV